MRRKGCAWLVVGAVVAVLLAHLLLSALPNRDDAVVAAVRGAGGEVRRTPRLLGLSTMTDAAIYPRGDVWLVEVRDAEVSDELAEPLSTLRSLDHLDLYRCRLAVRAAADLVPPAGSLRSISVTETNLGDEHLRRLGECPNLVPLILDGTDVTDASVPAITRCRGLGYSALRRHKLTAAGVAAIRAAFPRSNAVTEWSRPAVWWAAVDRCGRRRGASGCG